MAFTYNLATDVGKIRSLIRDVTQATAIFSDEELQGFLDIEGDVLNAAALALETISGQQAYVVKVIQVLDLKMDGTAVAKSLLATAARFRERAQVSEADNWCGFEVAETVDNSLFAYREKQVKLLLAQGA